MMPSLLERGMRLFSSPWSAIRWNLNAAEPRQWKTSRDKKFEEINSHLCSPQLMLAAMVDDFY